MSSTQSVFSYTNFVHAIAGSVGSSFAFTLFYPLDAARTRLQVDEHLKEEPSYAIILKILNSEGLSGLYRGWGPVVSSLVISNFVFFYTHNYLKMSFKNYGPSVRKDMGLAFISGVVNVLGTTPLWVVNTRLKLQGAKLTNVPDERLMHYQGVCDCFIKIIKYEGLWSLWSGTLPSLMLVFNPAIQFMIYESLKRNMTAQKNSKNLSGLLYFLIGALAKMASTLVTYPLQVVQARLRAGRNKETNAQMATFLRRKLLEKDGWKFFYRGLEAKLSQTVLMTATMFLTYEKIVLYIFGLIVGA